MKHLFEIWFVKECWENDVYEELKKDSWGNSENDAIRKLKHKYSDYDITIQHVKSVF